VGVGEKFQSNTEIAGSPRNRFRASVEKRMAEVERRIGLGACIRLPNPVKLRMPRIYDRQSDYEC